MGGKDKRSILQRRVRGGAHKVRPITSARDIAWSVEIVQVTLGTSIVEGNNHYVPSRLSESLINHSAVACDTTWLIAEIRNEMENDRHLTQVDRRILPSEVPGRR